MLRSRVRYSKCYTKATLVLLWLAYKLSDLQMMDSVTTITINIE